MSSLSRRLVLRLARTEASTRVKNHGKTPYGEPRPAPTHSFALPGSLGSCLAGSPPPPCTVFPCLCYYSCVSACATVRRQAIKRTKEKENKEIFVFGPPEGIRGMDLRFLEPNF
jgi:hypothetical protein